MIQDAAPASGALDLPDDAATARRLAEIRRQFGRTLAAWSCDLLALRARGTSLAAWGDLDEASWLDAA